MIPRERPNTRLYVQQRSLSLPDTVPPPTPSVFRRNTGTSFDPIAELRVRNIISEILHSFRAVFTSELQNMIQNLNLNTNQLNAVNKTTASGT